MRQEPLSRFAIVLTVFFLLLAPCAMAELSTDPAESEKPRHHSHGHF